MTGHDDPLLAFIAAREREEAAHDPHGQLPDEIWRKTFAGDLAQLGAAARTLGWAIVSTIPLQFARRAMWRKATTFGHPDLRQEWRP